MTTLYIYQNGKNPITQSEKSAPTAPAAHKDAKIQELCSLMVGTENEIVILEDILPVKNNLTS